MANDASLTSPSNETVTLKLPSGEEVDAVVPARMSDQQVHDLMKQKHPEFFQTAPASQQAQQVQQQQPQSLLDRGEAKLKNLIDSPTGQSVIAGAKRVGHSIEAGVAPILKDIVGASTPNLIYQGYKQFTGQPNKLNEIPGHAARVLPLAAGLSPANLLEAEAPEVAEAAEAARAAKAVSKSDSVLGSVNGATPELKPLAEYTITGQPVNPEPAPVAAPASTPAAAPAATAEVKPLNPEKALRDQIDVMTGNKLPEPLRPNVKLKDQLPSLRKEPLATETRTSAQRQIIHVNGEELDKAIPADNAEMREAFKNLTNQQIQQAAGRGGLDLGSKVITRSKFAGDGGLSRANILSELLSKGHTPQAILKLATAK